MSPPGEPPAPRRPIAVVVSRFPLVTETFILREINELERQGQPVVLVPLIRERPRVVHREAEPWLDRLVHEPLLSPAVVAANARALLRRPWRYLSTLARSVMRSLPDANLAAGALAMFPRSVHLAETLERSGVRHVHAHFATHPTTAALVMSELAPGSTLSFSFTAHAHDIMVHRAGLAAKIRGALFVRCISRFNRDLLASLAPDAAARLRVIHVGVDASRIEAVARDASAAPRLLCIAALKPYKGLPVLVAAMGVLRDRGVDVACDIVGEGPQREEIESLVARLGLHERVRLLGALRQDEVAALVARCSAFVLPSIVTRDGQMEGIPVALMEAMAARKPVISTRISGIPELIDDGRTGLLVAPGDATALADAMERLLRDDILRARLGAAGRKIVLDEFRLDACTEELLAQLDALAGEAPSLPAALPGLLKQAHLEGAIGVRMSMLRTDSRVTRLLIATPEGPRDVVLKEHLDREGASRPASIRARDEHAILTALHARFAERGSDAGVPRALALDAASASVLVDACAGSSLDEIIRAARCHDARVDLHEALHAAGRWLARFQAAARGLARLPERALEPVRARAHAAVARGRGSRAVARALAAFEELSARAASEVTVVHGDFWPGNVFVSGGRVEVIDFEGLRGGHACEDAAWFLVHLAMFFTRPWRAHELEPCEAAFLQGLGLPAADEALRACRLAVAMEMLARESAWRAGRRLALERLMAREIA